MMELLSLTFFQYALLAGILISISTSYLGVFIVQRGMSFLGDGLAHAALGGAAIGLFFGSDPLYVAIPFTVLIAFLITWVKNRTTLRADAAVGVFFSFAAALGVLFLTLRRDYSVEASTLLFGSILSVNQTDLYICGVLTALTIAFTPRWGKLAYATFDRELARADGVQVVRDDLILSFLVALSVAVAVRIVGVLLVSSFLVIPAASARLFSRRLSTLTMGSIGIAILSTIGGLLGSGLVDVPPGAMIVLFQSAIFFTLLLF